MKSINRFFKLNSDKISEFYELLNSELHNLNISEYLYVHGGAVMCDLGARKSTIDIDAYYKNTDLVNRISQEITKKMGFSLNVLNDDIKPFLSDDGAYRLFKDFGNLKVFYAEDEYMFALKCYSCRTDSNDVKDLAFLVNKLGITSQEYAADIISRFFNLKEVSILYKDVLEDIWSGVVDYLY